MLKKPKQYRQPAVATERFRYIQKHKTAEELQKSVPACVPNPAAVAEQDKFLYYITHSLSKSSENTQR